MLSLGDLYVSTFVDDKNHEGIKAPLELVICENPKCQLLQLKDTAPQEIMYSRHYWYRSALNPVITKDLDEILREAIKITNPRAKDVVLDIGANDGSLLAQCPKEFTRVGCEPADNLQEELKQRADYVIHDFWNAARYEALGLPKAKIVTAIGMFYDMEDPNQFIADAGKVLADDGIFIAQLMTLRPMIEKNDLGNICHEHLEYYSYPSLVYLFEKNGLEIFKVEENNINGGSYRLFARHLKNGSVEFREPAYDYALFAKQLEESKTQCVDFIKKVVAEGKTVYGYGASTKGNTILQYYGLDNSLIKAIADKSQEKWGKYTIGTNIPIISEEEARKAKPDYFLVLPYAFIDTFVAREQEWLAGGGTFIVPLPKFRTINCQAK